MLITSLQPIVLKLFIPVQITCVAHLFGFKPFMSEQEYVKLMWSSDLILIPQYVHNPCPKLQIGVTLSFMFYHKISYFHPHSELPLLWVISLQDPHHLKIYQIFHRHATLYSGQDRKQETKLLSPFIGKINNPTDHDLYEWDQPPNLWFKEYQEQNDQTPDHKIQNPMHQIIKKDYLNNMYLISHQISKKPLTN